MNELKEKSILELYNMIDNILYFLSTHNKNYTKKQYENILLMSDIISEIKDR